MLMNVLRTWFGVTRPVGRVMYALSGVGLMILKYAVEVALFWVFADTFLTPVDFFNPLLSAREQILKPGPPWLGWAIYVWTLPFLWISVSMSIRRAADVGLSPWMGFFVLVPLVNLCFMFILCLVPRRDTQGWMLPEQAVLDRQRPLRAAMSVGLGLLVGAVMIGTSVYGLSHYGGSLFLGTPIMMGATAGYFYHRGGAHGFGVSILLGMATVALGCVAMLLFALEGVVCLIMALPLAIPVGALGGLMGAAIAQATRRPLPELAAALLMLPAWAAGEARLAEAPLRVVMTYVEIEAPPETVWENVVEFPELPRERPWYFRLGIACPERARIVGRGVGAVRYCEFTTGAFVEPITAWNEPRQLAFDVTDQPAPMFELSPYRHVHPPHLDGFLVSTRGEFRLVELPGGRTRLEGRTWYRCAMFPQWYWTAWSDMIIHKIHERVLVHIETLAEGGTASK